MTPIRWCRWAASLPGAASSTRRWSGSNEGFRLNPFPPPWYSAALGNALYTLGRHDEAAAALKELPNPGPFTFARLVACHAQTGNGLAAEATKARLLQARPDFSTEDFIRHGLLLQQDEHRDLFRQGLLKAGLPK